MADEDLQINAKITIPDAELHFSASRSSGPGGQHANKTNSRVTLAWNIAASTALDDNEKFRVTKRLASRLNENGELQIAVDESRSQFRNRAIARQRLADMLREALKRKKRRIATKPSKAAKRRRLDGKKRTSQKKKLRKKPSKDND